jgi:hypothetical protein
VLETFFRDVCGVQVGHAARKKQEGYHGRNFSNRRSFMISSGANTFAPVTHVWVAGTYDYEHVRLSETYSASLAPS